MQPNEGVSRQRDLLDLAMHYIDVRDQSLIDRRGQLATDVGPAVALESQFPRNLVSYRRASNLLRNGDDAR